MTTSFRQLMKHLNGYSLSLLLHGLLILVSALYVFQPQDDITWHQFEWELPSPGLVSDNPAARGVPDQSNAQLNNKDANPISAESSSSENDDTAEKPARRVETPLDRPASNTKDAVFRPGVKRDLGNTALLNIGNNAPGGNMGFSSAMEPGSGDAYVIEQLKPQIVPTQDGEVLLEFRLSSRGVVIISSVNVVSFSSAAYVEAVRKVLPQWRFGFRKAYDPEKIYRIRCKFVTNE